MRWLGAAVALLAAASFERLLRREAAASERRFRELADELPLLIWTYAADGTIDYANRRLLRFIGYEGARRRIAANAFEAILAPSDATALRTGFAVRFGAGEAYEAEHRIKPPRADASEYRWFFWRVVPARSGGTLRWIGVAIDIHDAKLAAEQRDAQLRSIAEAAPIVVWRARPDGAMDYFSSRWTELTGSAPESSLGWNWLAAVHPADVAETTQSWRRALKTHGPYETEYRLRDARSGGYRWQLVRGVAQSAPGGPITAWLGSCTDIDDKKRSEANLRLLIDTGTQLLSSLGVRESFEAVVGVLVPGYADWAAISTVDESGVTRIAAIRHRDKELDARARELVTTTYGRSRGAGIAAPIRSGIPHVWPSLPADWLADVPAATHETLASFATLSAIAVPVRIGHRVAAILTLGRAQSDRGFEERDLPAYCELARRLGIATKHAESYDNERRVASSFQQAALPAALPSNERVSFDAVYEAGHSEALVGGDWYDAFVLVDGRVVVSIGDVSGNGLAAAVTMSVVRQSIRAAARIEPDPVAILDAADRTLQGDEPDRIVTAFVGIFDPATCELAYGGAGHPPPLLRRADGSVEELTARGVPLGLRRRDRPAHSNIVALEGGALIVLYTDGLTEATRDVFEGERLLREALADETVVSSREPAHAIKRRVLRRGSSDDVAILTLRVPFEACLPQRASRLWTLGAGDLNGSTAARHEFADTLRLAGVDTACAELAELVFGELVTNALQHGRGRVDVRLEWLERRPVLHVLDEGPGYRYAGGQPVSELSESGRGLFLVSRLTENFNVSRRAGGGSHSRAVLAFEAPRVVEERPAANA